MDIVFEVTDPANKKIRLLRKSYKHMNERHPELQDCWEMIKSVLQFPDSITESELDSTIRYFYKHVKQKRRLGKFLRVVVKYLNGSGIILTAHFISKRP